jgi:hypothetical protein
MVTPSQNSGQVTYEGQLDLVLSTLHGTITKITAYLTAGWTGSNNWAPDRKYLMSFAATLVSPSDEAFATSGDILAGSDNESDLPSDLLVEGYVGVDYSGTIVFTLVNQNETGYIGSDLHLLDIANFHAIVFLGSLLNTDSFEFTCSDFYLLVEYTSPASLDAVDPPSGGTLGADPVTLTGVGFGAGTTVTFDGAAATGVVVVSDTELTCLTPAHATGAVDVVVTFPDDSTSTLIGGFTYQIDASTPTVNAGQAQEAIGPPPSTVTLAAIVTRGKNNGTITQAWTQLSGPATPTITTPTALDTDITFYAYVPGVYVFECAVTTADLEGITFTATDAVTVTIQPTIAPRVSGGNVQV